MKRWIADIKRDEELKLGGNIRKTKIIVLIDRK